MLPLVEFPDVALLVTTYLRTQLAAHGYPGIRVGDKYVGADSEVWVRRDGGPVLDVRREAARVGVNVFAKGDTGQAVSDLARRVSTLMRAAPGGGPICRVQQLSGPSPIPDTLPRLYMTFELIVTGSDL